MITSINEFKKINDNESDYSVVNKLKDTINKEMSFNLISTPIIKGRFGLNIHTLLKIGVENKLLKIMNNLGIIGGSVSKNTDYIDNGYHYTVYFSRENYINKY